LESKKASLSKHSYLGREVILFYRLIPSYRSIDKFATPVDQRFIARGM
jgi:hypothetical protein